MRKTVSALVAPLMALSCGSLDRDDFKANVQVLLLFEQEMVRAAKIVSASETFSHSLLLGSPCSPAQPDEGDCFFLLAYGDGVSISSGDQSVSASLALRGPEQLFWYDNSSADNGWKLWTTPQLPIRVTKFILKDPIVHSAQLQHTGTCTTALPIIASESDGVSVVGLLPLADEWATARVSVADGSQQGCAASAAETRAAGVPRAAAPLLYLRRPTEEMIAHATKRKLFLVSSATTSSFEVPAPVVAVASRKQPLELHELILLSFAEENRGELRTCTSLLAADELACNKEDKFVPSPTPFDARRLFAISEGALLFDDGARAWLPDGTTFENIAGAPSSRVTFAADLGGAIGTIIAAEVPEIGGSVLLRRDDKTEGRPWRWWALLPGFTRIEGLANWRDGVLFGGAEGLGFFSRSEGAALVDSPLVKISSLVRVESGAVFVLGETATSRERAFIWLLP